MNPFDLFLIIASVALSALCSGLEIAFVTGNKLYIELERKRGAWWARLVSYLQHRPARVIGALLVGNNIALVVYGVLVGEALDPWLAAMGMSPWLVLAVQTALATLLILVVAEFLPKALFGIDPNRALALFALPLALLYVVLWPPMMLFTGMSELLLRLFRVRTRPGQIAFGRIDLDDFLREMSGGPAREQQIDAEVEYLRNTLELSNIKAREIMVPRARIEAIDAEDGPAQLHRRFVDTGLSKLLVYKDRIDNVIGYVHGYELFRHPRSIRAVMRPVNFIPGTMPADEVLQLFIKQRSHVAVVVDEYGGTAGMLTMEDVVETIVGDIEDEHDTPEEVEEKLADGAFLLSGRLEVERIRERFALDLPLSEEYGTLAGFILHHTGDLPEQGQVIEIPPFRFTIAQVAHGRIDLVRLETEAES
ncbi:MAG: HlyC/CorC family transporter [Flavobacteriales bacterium]|nr:HlyC/CorC family transporter [Flavobacteriales bacterium]